MPQRTIWIYYLTIGISLIGLESCSKKTVEPVSSAEYVYINKMDNAVTLIAYDLDGYNAKVIQSNDSVTLLTGGNVGTRPFVDNILAKRADSVVIEFSNKMCTTYRISFDREGDGVFDHKEYDNYSYSIVSKGLYRYIYTIDSTDYKKAVPCK